MEDRLTDKYEMVIGLEVHAELRTRTKLFCGCENVHGGQPNARVCPVCAGLPGTLPVMNRRAVELAVRIGLLTDCEIRHESRMDRKNYFYPDLPKGYQISQYDRPLCEHGHLDIEIKGGTHRVGIARVHIEEDAGKLTHAGGKDTLVDLNRAGVPLAEIVSMPDMRSAEEARAYLETLREALMRAEACDGRMNEGSLRADVNLSVRRRGETALGTRVEIKNLNSMSGMTKAIEGEFLRQAAAVEAGEGIAQETRRFDSQTGQTQPMRGKEDADDYRYFPDPDLPPIRLTDEDIAAIRRAMPGGGAR